MYSRLEIMGDMRKLSLFSRIAMWLIGARRSEISSSRLFIEGLLLGVESVGIIIRACSNSYN